MPASEWFYDLYVAAIRFMDKYRDAEVLPPDVALIQRAIARIRENEMRLNPGEVVDAVAEPKALKEAEK